MKSMILAAGLAVLTLATGAAAGAQAQAFTAAANSRFTLDLDTAAGNYSEWSARDLSGLDAMRAKVTIARLVPDKRWRPVARIVVGGRLEEAAFRVVSRTDGAPLEVSVMRLREGKVVGEVIALPTVRPDEVFRLEAQWTPAGLVTFVLTSTATGPGGAKASIQLDAAPTAVTAMVSTGEVKLAPIELGTVK